MYILSSKYNHKYKVFFKQTVKLNSHYSQLTKQLNTKYHSLHHN